MTLSGYTGSVQVWQSSVSPFTTWTDIANTNATYTSGPLTETTQFRAVIIGDCGKAPSSPTTVTVLPATVGGTVTGGTTICSGNTSGLLTLSGYTGSVQVWQSSVSPFTTWTDIANTNATYTSGPLTETTQFRAVIVGDCGKAPSSPTTVTVLPATVGGTVSGGTTITSGSTSGLLTLSGNTGSVQVWQSSVSPFTTWTDIANTNATYTSGPLTETTQFRAVVLGDCGKAPSEPTTVTVEGLPTITLVPSEYYACVDDFDSATTTLEYTATTGNPVTYSIVWNSSPANSLAAVTDAPLPASPITIAVPAGTNAGTYTGTLTVKNAVGISSSGSVFEINVGIFPFIEYGGAVDPISASATTQYATLTYAGGGVGNPESYSIDWNTNTGIPDQPFTSFAFSPNGGVINTIEVPANTPAGTYFGRLDLNGPSCTASYFLSMVINDAAPPTIALAPAAAAICMSNFSNGTTTLDYTGTTGNPTTYSIVWNSSPTNSLVAVSDAPLPTNRISIGVPKGTNAGTYTGTLIVKNAAGISSSGSAFELKVESSTRFITTRIIDPVNTSATVQYATLAYSGITGSTPVSYGINWKSPAIPNQPQTSFAFSPSGGVINTIEIPANVPAGTYLGDLILISPSCGATVYINASITINPASTARPVVETQDLESAENTILVSVLNQVINVNTFNQKMNQVFIYDVSGNLLYQRDRVGESKWSIDRLRSSNQILLVKVVLDDNTVVSRKVIF